MNARDNLVTVLEVACLTADRSPEEQRALLAVALRLDLERGAFVQANYRNGAKPDGPRLMARVEGSYEPDGPRVKPTKAQLDQWTRLMERWYPCPVCSEPMGAHGLNDRCP